MSLTALATSGCQGPADGEPALDLRSAALTNSALTATDPAVGTVLAGTQPVCSGTLIGERLVITAAHCLMYQPTTVLFVNPPLLVTIAMAAPHPKYDRRTQRFDMAMLILATAVTTVPPVALGRAGVLKLQMGTALRLVGFGAETEGMARWEKRQGRAAIAFMDPDSIQLEGESRPCSGDSGGAALVAVREQEFLAAVISRGDVDCPERPMLSRVDSQFDGFISEYGRLAISMELPARARCLSDANCVTGRCANAVDSRSLATCTGPCARDADCGERGFVCDVPAGACRSATPPGAFLAPCETDGQCDSVLCGGATMDGPRYCTRSCRPDDVRSCDDSSTCVEAADSAAAFVCVPRGTAPAAQLGSGCSLAPDGPGGRHRFGAGGWLLAALALTLGRRFSRRG